MLIGLVLTLILPLAIGAHMLAAVMFYGWQLRIALDDPACLAAADAPAADAAAAAALDPHCQTEDSLFQAKMTVGIVCGAALLWGGALVHYLARESSRRVEQGLHVFSEQNLVARYIDVLTVQQEEASTKHLLHQPLRTPFRRQTGLNLYMPPLPKSVLRKLKTSGGGGPDREPSIGGEQCGSGRGTIFRAESSFLGESSEQSPHRAQTARASLVSAGGRTFTPTHRRSPSDSQSLAAAARSACGRVPMSRLEDQTALV